MIKLIRTIQERYYSLDEWKIQLNIYGGEPLLAINEIAYLSNMMPKYTFVIVTNGSLIDKNIDKILRIYNQNHRLQFNVSYDYCMQNQTRQANTYDLIRNNIKLLDTYGIYTHTITTFTAQNITRFYDVVVDWDNMRNELRNDRFNLRYNIDDNLVSFHIRCCNG